MATKSDVPRLLESAAQSDVGTTRMHNEDKAAADASLGVCVVADGMGGQGTGEEASELTVTTILQCLRTQHTVGMSGPPWEKHMLVEAIRLANVRVVHASHTNYHGEYTLHSRGLGSTVAAALGAEGGVLIAHVGDSRCYRWRDGQLELLTEDHTLRNEYVKTVNLTPEEIAQIPTNVLVRIIGFVDPPKVDVRFEPLRAGDVYLLCTDGLSSVLTDADIAGLLREHETLADACRSLIETANARETPDNLSVALGRWG
jgi:PPM family protein phosphatase